MEHFDQITSGDIEEVQVITAPTEQPIATQFIVCRGNNIVRKTLQVKVRHY